MTLNESIYQKMIFGERFSKYKLYDEFWYVVKWNDQTYIHYTMKQVSNSCKFLWYLSASIDAPKFRSQTQEITIWSSAAKLVPPETN